MQSQVSMAAEGATQVAEGNWRIFHNMMVESGARVQLNTSVTSVAFSSDADSPTKYTLKSKSTGSGPAMETTEPVEFDNVVIATPYQFSNIKISDDVLHRTIDEIPYVKLHVTLLTSPFRISPGFFKLPAGSSPPTTILTTLGDDEDPSSGHQGAGKAGFFSISTLRRVINPNTHQQEYLYKIFSPEEVTAKFLSNMLGVDIPDTFTGAVANGSETEMVEPISWSYRHVFNSYPRAYPRVTFQDPILRDGLYYTSGMESFISTMETNALMGMNVARLIVDDVLPLKSGGAVTSNDGARQDDSKTPDGAYKIDEL